MNVPPRVSAHPPVLPELAFEVERRNQGIQMQPLGQPAVGGAAPVSSVNDPQVLLDLEQKMADIFAPHETPENRQALGALVKDRAGQLQAMGQTAADVERLLDKATRMDRVALPAVGAMGSAPFAVASVLLDRVPAMTAKTASSPAYTGFVAGSFSGALDTAAGGVMGRALHDAMWLKAPAEALEPVMQEAQAAKAQENPGGRALQSAAAYQTFSLRNVARGLVATALVGTGHPKTAAAMDTVLGSAGGMAAGAGYVTVMRGNDLHAHRAGPEYLFGRKDWKKQYETLRDCSPTRDPLINAGKRLAKLPLDMMTDTAKALGGVISATSATTNGLALGGGSALSTMARAAVKGAAAKAGLSPAIVAAADSATNIGLSAITFGAYGALGVLTGPASEAVSKTLQEEVPAKAMSAASAVAEGLSTAAEAGANAVAGLANTLRQRPARGVDPQGDSEV
ncbi:MAG: hypothetical protein GAK37_00375 [Pseudomonas sp.]|nr:MAG: hypothetical protein GAK37_00375 [Pseudomonas sp.]